MTSLALALSLVLTQAPAASAAPDAEVAAATKKWHEQRVARLTAEGGWLSLVGLEWLRGGVNTVGSSPKSGVKLPASVPAEVGTMTVRGTEVTFTPKEGVEITVDGKPFKGGVVKNDTDGDPDELRIGSVQFYVIQRGNRIGVRVKDAEAPARKNFHGIEMFDPKAAWRIEAAFIPTANSSVKVAKVSVPTVIGSVDEMVSPGKVRFVVDGKEQELVAVTEGDSDKLFIIFGDATNRKETYGAGRFLYADAPKDGKVVLDFNRAYNPPCAFSAYATCPLPPRENKLDVRIEAGEKRYGNH